jgi:hypothetical protein
VKICEHTDFKDGIIFETRWADKMQMKLNEAEGPDKGLVFITKPDGSFHSRYKKDKWGMKQLVGALGLLQWKKGVKPAYEYGHEASCKVAMEHDPKSIEAWQCVECDQIDEDRDEAKECCGKFPRKIEAYKCPKCGELKEDSEEAEDCCKAEEVKA